MQKTQTLPSEPLTPSTAIPRTPGAPMESRSLASQDCQRLPYAQVGQGHMMTSHQPFYRPPMIYGSHYERMWHLDEMHLSQLHGPVAPLLPNETLIQIDDVPPQDNVKSSEASPSQSSAQTSGGRGLGRKLKGAVKGKMLRRSNEPGATSAITTTTV